MSKSEIGSLNLTTILAAARAKHSAFWKAASGDIHFNIQKWNNEQPDQYGNDSSIKLNSKKEMREAEKDLFKKGYIGNMKIQKPKEEEGLSDQDSKQFDDITF